MATATAPHSLALYNLRAKSLREYYRAAGASDNLVNASLACNYCRQLEAWKILTANPVLPEAAKAAAEWAEIRRDLYLDTVTGAATDSPDFGGPDDDRYLAWPVSLQTDFLFSRWSYLFQ